MLDPSRGPFEQFWGHVDSRNALPGGQRGRISISVKHFFSKTLLLPGTGVAEMYPERVYVAPPWGYVEAVLAHLGSMLGPCSPILGLC